MQTAKARSLPPFPESRSGPLQLSQELAARAISLRPATEADLPYLCGLFASTRADEMSRVPWPQAAKRVFLEDQFALQHQHYLAYYADADFLMIERGGTTIGRYYLRRTEPDYLIVDISLDPEVQGLGIGSALIEWTQSDAQRRGCGVSLSVMTDNTAARRLYARLSFDAAGQADSGYERMRWAPNAASVS